MMPKVKTVILLRVGLLLKGPQEGAQSGMLIIWFLMGLLVTQVCSFFENPLSCNYGICVLLVNLK